MYVSSPPVGRLALSQTLAISGDANERFCRNLTKNYAALQNLN